MIETKEIMSREAVTGGIFECRYDESLTLTQADNSLFRLLGMNAGSLTSRYSHLLSGPDMRGRPPNLPGKNTVPAVPQPCIHV